MKTDNLESFCRVLESLIKYRVNVLGYLCSHGCVRLVEAGRGVRVYHFFSVTGDKAKIILGEDGFFSVAPLGQPEKIEAEKKGKKK